MVVKITTTAVIVVRVAFAHVMKMGMAKGKVNHS